MAPRLTSFAALLMGMAVAAAPAHAQDEAPAEAEASTEQAEQIEEAAPALSGPELYDATLERDLYVQSPVMLNGILAVRDIPFSLPPNWEITDDIELHLLLDHSETLLRRRSSMTVLVNNRAVESFFLDETNAVGGEVVARIPREVLSEYNVLTLTAVQHYTTDCEDPFDPNLWTRVSNLSFFRIPYERTPIEADLVQFPAPFFNANGLGPVSLALVTSATVPEPTIAALGVLGLAFGRIADYRGLDITQTVGSVHEATGHALLVGLYGDHPEIRELVGSQSAGDNDGVVALVPNPSDPSLAVLVVTGKTPEALRRAAYSVAGEDRYEVLSGPRAVITEVRPGFPDSRRKPAPAPTKAETFRLADMNYEDRSVRGFYSDPVVIPLMLEGDAQVQPEQASMTLHYAYSAQLDTRLSTVEVALDGVTLASRPLDNRKGDQDAELEVNLPAALLQPKSVVKVTFHLFPKEFDACERVSDRIIWGTVFATTSFSIKRDNFAMMPDISRLAYDLWPFTMEGDAGSVLVIAPDVPTRQDAAAVFATAGALGWRRTAAEPRFRATTAAEVPGPGLPNEHIILLHSGSKNTAFEALAASPAMRMTDSSSGGRLLSDERQVLIDASMEPTYGTLEEIQQPDAPDKSILVIRSTSAENILPLAQTLSDDEALEQLKGNIAAVPEDLEEAVIRTYERGKQRQVGVKPLNTRITAGLSNFYPAFGLLLLGAALLFSLVVSLWARRNGAHT